MRHSGSNVNFHLVCRELDYEEGEVGLVCEGPKTIIFLVFVHRDQSFPSILDLSSGMTTC